MTIQLAMEHKKLRVKEMRTVKENEGACKVATDKEDIDLKPYKTNQLQSAVCLIWFSFPSSAYYHYGKIYSHINHI